MTTTTNLKDNIDIKVRRYTNDFFMIGSKSRSSTTDDDDDDDAEPLFASDSPRDSNDGGDDEGKPRGNSQGSVEETGFNSGVANKTSKENNPTAEEILLHDNEVPSDFESKQEIISYEKTFQWKIPGFMKHIKRAASNPRDSILLSPDFYIPGSKTRVAVKLYPSGSEDDEGMYLSIYFRLNPMDDSILVNRREVTFSVLSPDAQLKNEERISYHMNLPCTAARAVAATVGSGCHKCFSLKEMQERGLLINDIVFISVAIEEEIQSSNN